MTLSLVTPKDVPYVWVEVKPLIDKALKHTAGEMNSSDVLNLILNKNQVLWLGLEDEEIFCAGTTELIYYPKKTILRIVTFASKSGHHYELWKDFIDTLEDYAHLYKCSAIEAWVRKGLAKKLKWDNEYSVITKQL